MAFEDDVYSHSGDEHGPDEVPNDPFEGESFEHEQQSEGKQETEILKARRNLKETPARKSKLTFQDDDPVSSPAQSRAPGMEKDDRSLQDMFDGMPSPLGAKEKGPGDSQKPSDDAEEANAEGGSLKSNGPSANDALTEDITCSMDKSFDKMNTSPSPAPNPEKPTGGGKNKGRKRGKKAEVRRSFDGKTKQTLDVGAEKAPDEDTEKGETNTNEKQVKAIKEPGEEPAPRPNSPSAPRSSVAAMAAKMNKDASGGSPLRPSLKGSSASLARSFTAGRPSGLQRSIAVGNANSRRPSLAPSVNGNVPETSKTDTPRPSSPPPTGKPNNLPNWGKEDPVQLPLSAEPPGENADTQSVVLKPSVPTDDLRGKVDKVNEETSPTAVLAPQVSEVAALAPAKVVESKPNKNPELPKKDQSIEPSPAPATATPKAPPSTPIDSALLKEKKPPSRGPVSRHLEGQKTDSTPVQVKSQDSIPSTTGPSPSSGASPKTPPQTEPTKEIKAAPPGPLISALRRKSVPGFEVGTSKDVAAAPLALPGEPETTEGSSSPGSPPTSPSIFSLPPASQTSLVPDCERGSVHGQKRPQGLQRRKSVSFEQPKRQSERQSRRASYAPTRHLSSSPKYKHKVIDRTHRRRKRSANTAQADDEPEGEDVVCTSSEDWCGECQQKSTKVSAAVPQRYLDCDPEYYPVTLSCVLHGKTNDAGDIAAAVAKRLSQFTATDVPVHAVVRRAAAGTHRAGKWYDVTTKEGCSTGSGKLVKSHQKTTSLEVFFWRWTMNRDERRKKMSHEKRKLRDFRLLIDLSIPVEEDGPIELEIAKALPSNVTVQKATLIKDHPCSERLSWWARTHGSVYDRVSSRQKESESRSSEHSSRRRSSNSHRSFKESKSRPKSLGASLLRSLFSGSSSLRNEITGASSRSRNTHSDNRHRRRGSTGPRDETDVESFLAPPSSNGVRETSHRRRRDGIYRESEAGSFLQSPTIREV